MGYTWKKCIGRDCPKIDMGWENGPRGHGSGHGSGRDSGEGMDCPFTCDNDYDFCPCLEWSMCAGITEDDDPMEYNHGGCFHETLMYCCFSNPDDYGCQGEPLYGEACKIIEDILEENRGSGGGSGSGHYFDC